MTAQPLNLIRSKEKAILVGLELTDRSDGIYPNNKYSQLSTEDSLAELALLAEAAGAEVLSTMQQKRNHPDPSLFIGRGLAETIAAAAAETEADLIIFDDELSGSQLNNLEKIINVRIVDRTALILDIFAQRARSKEGHLQVELAQLKYRLPRLTGANTQLSRLAGGIGTRGPGESKLESDRRYIRQRIHEIENRLKKIRQQRQVLSHGSQHNIPTIALIGYTNSGKSTLRYQCCKQAAVSNRDLSGEDSGTDMLFATLDSTARRIALPNGGQADFVDTVGFIQKLPHQLISAFKSTLEEVLNADLLIHVADITHPNFEQQIRSVEQVLKELKADHKKMILAANKIDLLNATAKEEILNDHFLIINSQNNHFPSIMQEPQMIIPVSAKDGTGIDKLLQAIAEQLRSDSLKLKMLIPYSAAHDASWLHGHCHVLNNSFDDRGEYLEVLLARQYLQRFIDYII